MSSQEHRPKAQEAVPATDTSTSTSTATADTAVVQAAATDVPASEGVVPDRLDGYLGGQEEEEVSAVDQGVARMDLALEGLDPDDPDATHAAVADGVAAYREQLESLPPEERAAFIDASADQISALLQNAKDMDPEQLSSLMGDLVVAGELLGQDGIDQLVGVVGDDLAALMEADPSAFVGIQDGLIQGVFEGDGALLMSAFTASLERGEDPMGYGSSLRSTQAQMFEQIASQQAEAANKAAELDAAFGNWVANNIELYGEEGVAAAEQAFREEHAEEYAELAERDRALASVLEAAAYNQENANPYALGGWAAEQDQALLEQSVDLGQGYEKGDDGTWRRSSFRDQVFGDALLRSGEGETTWLDAAHDLGADRPGLGDELAAAEQQAVFTISQALTVDGKFDEVGTLLEGLGAHNPEFADVGAAISERLAEVQARAEAGEISWDEASEELVKAFQDGMEGVDIPDSVRDRVVAMGLGVQGAMHYAASLGRQEGTLEQFMDGGAGFLTGIKDTDQYGGAGLGRLSVLASGLSLISNINDFVQGDGDFNLAVQTLWGVGSVADDMLKLMTGSGSKLMQTIGLPVGLALAGINLIDVIASGGTPEEIAIASLPLAGAGVGAAIGVWFFGVGAGVGAAAGLAIGGALQFLAGIFGIGQADPTEEYAEDTDVLTEAALRAVLPAGTSEEVVALMTDELSRVNDDFVGVGPVLGLVADDMGVSPTELLGQLAELAGGEGGPELLQELMRSGALEVDSTNMDEIEEAREKLQSGEEVDVPKLEYDAAQVAALSRIFGQAIRTGQSPVSFAEVKHSIDDQHIPWDPDRIAYLEESAEDGDQLGVVVQAETLVLQMSYANATGGMDEYVRLLEESGRSPTDLLEALNSDPASQAMALDLLLQSGAADQVQAWAEANGVDPSIVLGGPDQDPAAVAAAVEAGTFDPARLLANTPDWTDISGWVDLYREAGLDVTELLASAVATQQGIDPARVAELAEQDPAALGQLFRDQEQTHSGWFNSWDPKTGEMTPILAAVSGDPAAAQAFVEGYLREAQRDDHGGNSVENLLKAYDEHGSPLEVQLALEVLEAAGYGDQAEAWRESHGY